MQKSVRRTATAMLVGTALLTSGGLAANAQSNYMPGVVITASGDSLSGLIDFREWNRSPESIAFKLEGENDPVDLTAHTAKAIHVSSERYVSRVVTVDQLPAEFFESAWAGSGTTVQDTVFLAVLVEGPVTLYHYGDSKDHFYVEADGVLEELLYHKRIRELGGRTFLVEDTRYQDQLPRFLEDCAHLKGDLKDVRFTRKSLMRVTADYNQCILPGSIAFIRRERRLGIEAGVVLGIARSELNVEEHLLAPDFAGSTNTAAGLSLTVKQARNRQKYSFRGEVLWVRYSADASDYGPGARLQADYVKLVTMLRYTLPTSSVRPYVEVGLTNGWAAGFRSTIQSNGSVQAAFLRDLLDETSARRYERGIALGIGAQRDRFELQVRVERSNGFSPLRQDGTGTAINYLYVLMGYRLGGTR